MNAADRRLLAELGRAVAAMLEVPRPELPYQGSYKDFEAYNSHLAVRDKADRDYIDRQHVQAIRVSSSMEYLAEHEFDEISVRSTIDVLREQAAEPLPYPVQAAEVPVTAAGGGQR